MEGGKNMKKHYVSLDNFDDENINSVEMLIEEEKSSSNKKRAYTMIQDNSFCDVEVTQSSRDKCAEILVK